MNGSPLWETDCRSPAGWRGHTPSIVESRATARGFTLLEILIVIAVLATLLTIGVPLFVQALDDARIRAAAEEIRALQTDIMTYEQRTGLLPDRLGDVRPGRVLDPWGHPYEYLRIAVSSAEAGARGKSLKGKLMGQVRKDRSLVPLNSDYDLYSRGRDGQSKPPLTAKQSHDDIIRANDGEYIGLAADY